MMGLWVRGARIACATLGLCFVTTTSLLAATVTLSPATWNAGKDGNSTLAPRDGQFDTLLPATNINVNFTQVSETRSLYEFILPAYVMAPGTVINSASLTLGVNLESLGGGNANMVVHGYLANDAVITVDDFEVSNPVSEMTIFTGMPYATRTYNIPYWLQTLPGGSNNRIGLIVATTTIGTNLRYNGPTAQLTIDYTPPVGTPPQLTILSPDDNASYVNGTSISFQATAFDNEDGDRSWGIQWNSNINGYFGYGGNVLTNQLSVGTHLITAQVYDFDGNTATKQRTINVTGVVNNPPTVVIYSPHNGGQLVTGEPTNLVADASDPEQGSLNSIIQWYLDDTTFLGTGSNISATIPVGQHRLTARVTDNGGLSVDQSISVLVSDPPPAGVYCPTNSWNVGRYWLQSVAINSFINNSGSNGGYGDYSATTIPLNKGQVSSVTLTPGSISAGTTQWWSVWIDYNRDMVFSSSELVTQGSTVSSSTRLFLVRNEFADGPTRMRIAMHTNAPANACGTFYEGEVEDYTVNLVTPPPPPPPPPTPPTTPPTGYCASRGTYSSYEHIRSTSIAGIFRQSNNNQGYGDFTSTAQISLVRGANAITLTPGFGSGTYTEQWKVWVDLNRNGVFDSNEALYSGGSNSTINGQIVIPTTATAGATRLRVQMKYGSAPAACETFSYGEVEDYTVVIPSN